jgi:hypothetical protein
MRLQGRWRIVETEIWAKADLDIAETAFIRLDPDGGGELAVCALTAALDCASAEDNVDFTWNGSDEGDEVRGSGWAELAPNGDLEGEFSYDNGDETTFRGVSWPASSTAC